MQTQHDGAEDRLVVALVQGRAARRHGVRLLHMLREYRADVTAPWVAENAKLRAEIERLKTGRGAP
jgi:hypothetical protein